MVERKTEELRRSGNPEAERKIAYPYASEGDVEVVKTGNGNQSAGPVGGAAKYGAHDPGADRGRPPGNPSNARILVSTVADSESGRTMK